MENEKIILEFNMKSTPLPLLWNYISSASGLKQWFADDVVVEHKEFTFKWKGASQIAHLIGNRTMSYIKFRWEDEDPKKYFELKILSDELTDSRTLVITDFGEDVKDLWNAQVDVLKRLLGC